jgi:hypothetical protein
MTATPLQHLHTTLPDAHPADAWRWQVRRLIGEVRDLLVHETPASYDGWLAARGAGMIRERNTLLGRLAALGPRVLHDPAGDEVLAELRRLLADVEHHLQRRRDLVWDEVEMELGGSE